MFITAITTDASLCWSFPICIFPICHCKCWTCENYVIYTEHLTQTSAPATAGSPISTGRLPQAPPLIRSTTSTLASHPFRRIVAGVGTKELVLCTPSSYTCLMLKMLARPSNCLFSFFELFITDWAFGLRSRHFFRDFDFFEALFYFASQLCNAHCVTQLLIQIVYDRW